MDILITYLQEFIVPILCSLFSMVIASIISWLRTKFKNNQLLLLIPDAMEYAEGIGGTSSAKLENCLMFLRDRLKHFSESQAKKIIEKHITTSKTINKKGETNHDKSSTSRTTR